MPLGNVMKTRGRADFDAVAGACESREFREFHGFRNLDLDLGIRSAKFELEFIDF